MIRTTNAQRKEMCAAIAASNALRNEKVWTCLVADILANAPDQGPLIELFCDAEVPQSDRIDVWFESQSLPSRKGIAGNTEGNSRIDLVFGDVQARVATGSGIKYAAPVDRSSWVCFVEAKCLSDCSTILT